MNKKREGEMEHKSARLNAFLYIFVCVPKIDIYVRA